MKHLSILALILLASVSAAWAIFPFPSPMLMSETAGAAACASIGTPSQLAARYDASGLATGITNIYGTVDGSGNVSQWNDLSTSAAYGTATAKPTLNIAAQNGRNTLRFTAASSQYFSLSNTLSLQASSHTFIGVVRHGGPTGTPITVTFSNGSSAIPQTYPMLWYTDNNIYSTNTADYGYTTSTITDTASYHLVTVILTYPSTFTIRYDRATVGSSVAALVGGATWTTIGAWYSASVIYANSDMAELCLYSAALGSTDYTAVENALRTKWGTP